MRLGRALLVWLILIAAEFIHGILRVLFLAPQVGDFRARQIGAVIGSIIVLAVAYLFVEWIGAKTRDALMETGAMWLGLTLLFEIGLGRLVFRYSWGAAAGGVRSFERWTASPGVRISGPLATDRADASES